MIIKRTCRFRKSKTCSRRLSRTGARCCAALCVLRGHLRGGRCKQAARGSASRSHSQAGTTLRRAAHAVVLLNLGHMSNVSCLLGSLKGLNGGQIAMLSSYLNTTSLNLPPAAPTTPGHPTNATTTFTFSTFQLVQRG